MAWKAQLSRQINFSGSAQTCYHIIENLKSSSCSFDRQRNSFFLSPCINSGFSVEDSRTAGKNDHLNQLRAQVGEILLLDMSELKKITTCG